MQPLKPIDPNDPRMAEYDRLFSEVDELTVTKGPDDPECQEKGRQLLELQAELGVENDPGIDPDE